MSGSFDLVVQGGRTLIDGDFAETSLQIAGRTIADVGGGGRAPQALDASGLLVLPGIVDLHGDAFERQIMPRPGVDFPSMWR